MSLDVSKHSFDPTKDFTGVLMQQGRVQLDSDWNEMVEIIDRRWRSESLDIIGRAVVPKETPDGFKIGISGANLTIGAGRIYVDGLQAENHGAPPQDFDPVLAELRSDSPIDYDEQPYLPNAAQVSPLPENEGPHLVYLDVWERELSHLQEPDLIEKAVAVDTTGRAQTVWQVKVLPEVGGDVTCDTDAESIPGWEEITEPSAARLTTGVVSVTDEGPCVIPPNGNYRGLENQLYRVEIHDGGPQGTATFKWSRDNASVAARVEAVKDLDKLVVESVGRDAYLRFNAGDWVEVTDDWREFAGLPGHMREIKSVDDATRTLTLEDPLPGGAFPVDAQDQTDPARHTRVRRWDHEGEVRDENGNLIIDLDAGGSDGLIPVPPTGVHVVLENGVAVSFDLEPAGGEFKPLDYWTFAARTVDASVEPLTAAPPLGIHHHFARLALVTFPSTVTDCRQFWPPEFGAGGCDCDVCVTPESHASGAATIQWAIDQVKEKGGTVCLGSGFYQLGDDPIRIDGARSLRLHGQGWMTFLSYAGDGPAFVVQNSLGVRIEGLLLMTSGEGSEAGSDMLLRNCLGVTLQRCGFIQLRGGDLASPAVGLAGLLFGVRVRENVILARAGIGNTGLAQSETVTHVSVKEALPLFTSELFIEGNHFFCRDLGVTLAGFALHTGESRLAHNILQGCAQAGIQAAGWVMPGSGMDIGGNEVRVTGHGILVGSDGARIVGNDVSAAEEGASGHGIALISGLDPDGVEHGQILGNRMTDLGGAGIHIATRVTSAMIKQNVIKGAAMGGIIMSEQAKAVNLSVENNQLLDVAPQANDPEEPVVGIRLLQTDQAEVSSNTIFGLGRSAMQSPARVGIQVAGRSVRVAGNEIADIGPRSFVSYSAGVEVFTPFDRADVVDNVIRRSRKPPASADSSSWFALRIMGASVGMWKKGIDLKSGMKMVVDDNSSSVSSAGANNPAWSVSESSMFAFSDADNLFAINKNSGYILVGEWAVGVFGRDVLILPRGHEIVGVRGNLFEAYGDAPAVLIIGEGAFGFSDNRCLLDAPESTGEGQPVVRVAAGAVIVNANYLQGPGGRPALQMILPKDAPFTALGNIASGAMLANGQALDEPWAPLNALGI